VLLNGVPVRADIQIANAKKQSKATQQRKEQAKNNIATSHAPAVAQRESAFVAAA
jgi:hypothetical protein